VRPGGLTIEAGGRLDGEQIAAIAAAISTVLDEERAATRPVDPLPAAYRSAWRRAAIRDALDAGTVR
jgi:hypothetical protein